MIHYYLHCLKIIYLFRQVLNQICLRITIIIKMLNNIITIIIVILNRKEITGNRTLIIVIQNLLKSVNVRSKGCNEKIKELQAAAVTTPEDVIGVRESKAGKEDLAIQLTLEQARIISILEDCESAHFSELLAKSGLSVNELTALLSEMEIYGFINKLSGNFYALAAKL